MISIEEVRARTQGHASVIGVDTVRKGHIRIETVFQYPDGDGVDLFIRCDRAALTLSDLGQTTMWLSYLFDTEGVPLEVDLESLDGLLAGVETLGREAVRITNERVP